MLSNRPSTEVKVRLSQRKPSENASIESRRSFRSINDLARFSIRFSIASPFDPLEMVEENLLV